MLVVDRRVTVDQIAYLPGANCAEGQAELERHLLDHDALGSAALPVQVAVEPSDGTRESGQGVVCIIESPGPEALLQIMLERVWGVSDN
jgi:hypothetical protein